MRSEHNRIIFDVEVTGDTLPIVAAFHNLINKQKYQDLILDFHKSKFLAPQCMIMITSLCINYRNKGIDFDIIFPEDAQSAALIRNTNWAFLMCPAENERSDDKNVKNVAARQFFSPDEHFKAVDSSLDVMLRSIPRIDRKRLKALEWSLNEITDNVLNHSQSPVGGIMQVMTFPKKQRVEFYVCDGGITIPKSLRGGQNSFDGDASALRGSIDEGVTRNSSTNRGNGLFGTSKCCEVSGGEFDIVSGFVSLKKRNKEIQVARKLIPFPGTYIRASIGYSYEKLLEEALIFRGKSFEPAFDYIERIYQSDGDRIIFKVAKELNAFGSRDSGRMARTKIENLMDNFSTPIEIDFSDIHLISSSFADEVFGKIVEEIGLSKFEILFNFIRIDSTIKALIERAVAQRVS